jgi:hypothetical protein
LRIEGKERQEKQKKNYLMENVIQFNWVLFCCGLILLLCADDALPTLFEKYTQVTTSGNYGGTGLGLAICKNLVSYFCVYFMCFFHFFIDKIFQVSGNSV